MTEIVGLQRFVDTVLNMNIYSQGEDAYTTQRIRRSDGTVLTQTKKGRDVLGLEKPLVAIGEIDNKFSLLEIFDNDTVNRGKFSRMRRKILSLLFRENPSFQSWSRGLSDDKRGFLEGDDLFIKFTPSAHPQLINSTEDFLDYIQKWQSPFFKHIENELTESIASLTSPSKNSIFSGRKLFDFVRGELPEPPKIRGFFVSSNENILTTSTLSLSDEDYNRAISDIQFQQIMNGKNLLSPIEYVSQGEQMKRVAIEVKYIPTLDIYTIDEIRILEDIERLRALKKHIQKSSIKIISLLRKNHKSNFYRRECVTQVFQTLRELLLSSTTTAASSLNIPVSDVYAILQNTIASSEDSFFARCMQKFLYELSSMKDIIPEPLFNDEYVRSVLSRIVFNTPLPEATPPSASVLAGMLDSMLLGSSECVEIYNLLLERGLIDELQPTAATVPTTASSQSRELSFQKAGFIRELSRRILLDNGDTTSPSSLLRSILDPSENYADFTQIQRTIRDYSALIREDLNSNLLSRAEKVERILKFVLVYMCFQTDFIESTKNEFYGKTLRGLLEEAYSFGNAEKVNPQALSSLDFPEIIPELYNTEGVDADGIDKLCRICRYYIDKILFSILISDKTIQNPSKATRAYFESLPPNLQQLAFEIDFKGMLYNTTKIKFDDSTEREKLRYITQGNCMSTLNPEELSDILDHDVVIYKNLPEYRIDGITEDGRSKDFVCLLVQDVTRDIAEGTADEKYNPVFLSRFKELYTIE